MGPGTCITHRAKLADAENAQTCAFRGVTEYISAALAIGWDLTAG